jgi:hypothetical protein
VVDSDDNPADWIAWLVGANRLAEWSELMVGTSLEIWMRWSSLVCSVELESRSMRVVEVLVLGSSKLVCCGSAEMSVSGSGSSSSRSSILLTILSACLFWFSFGFCCHWKSELIASRKAQHG